MKIYLVLMIFILTGNALCAFPLLGGQGYSIIPDTSFHSAYDYTEIDGFTGKDKRYSYELYPGYLNIGMTKKYDGDTCWDVKLNLGEYDTLLITSGAFGIDSDSDTNNYYVLGTVHFETIGGVLTAGYFLEDGDFQWGYAYSQSVTDSIDYIIEKRGAMRNRGYRVNVGGSFFYENIELDNENKYNLRNKKIKNFVYESTY
ncbi:MAG: hypothetical protein ACOCWO_05905 [Candidatus Muiribacteriaceae bacterium]